MNKGLVAAIAIAIVILGGTYYMHRPRPEPVAEAPVAPAPTRIVPKKVEPPTPVPTAPSTDAARKAAPPKKAADAPPAPSAPSAPTLASLSLDTDVPGASVFIDRQFVGNTPLSLDKLEPGTKRIQVTATGFDSVQKTIELNPGPNSVSIRVKEVTLNAKVGVVHKHGMGSCDGTLIATLDGLRYDTSNKGDAFNIPFAQVETFTVDYLEKNLRVKQKGGKTWNFTLPDKSGSADPLFVFHRDVEAARKKLSEGYAKAQ